MTPAITYSIEPDLSADEFIDILVRSSLAERRPIGEPARIRRMLANADLIVTARMRDGRLAGVSRCLTDFAFCCYCSDLVVDRSLQRHGIGRRLIDESVRAAGEHARFFLLSAPAATGFYERIGMTRRPDCFERRDWKRFADGAEGAHQAAVAGDLGN